METEQKLAQRGCGNDATHMPCQAPVTLEMIQHAAQILKPVVKQTPVFSAHVLSDNLFIKAENLQRTGSFKVRGAYCKISSLTDEEAARGVVCCSAGNHAQGVALAASLRGVRSVVCMPASAPLLKVEATKNYGGEVVLVEGNFDDAADYSVKLSKEMGYVLAHPYDDPQVMAGQGTIGLEILEQVPDVEQVVVPVGGGGLISGVACAIKSLRPDVRVVGVQTAQVGSMFEALKTGNIAKIPDKPTIADGIHVLKPGTLTYDCCKQFVDDMVLVTENQICAAIIGLMEITKIVCEGAGAAAVAAFCFKKVDTSKKTVCIASGGNVDITQLSRIISRGLLATSCIANISVELPDYKRDMTTVMQIIDGAGGVVSDIIMRTDGENDSVAARWLGLSIEVVGPAHKQQILDALSEHGFVVEQEVASLDD